MSLSERRISGRTATLSRFEGVFRYYDPEYAKVMVKILPGEFYLSQSPDELVVTILGSCISVCMRDSEAGIGGMNHFMLPGTTDRTAASLNRSIAGNSYGVYAMESLITGILKYGGCRERLEIKVTGGGRIGSGSSTVGASNIQFIRDFLTLEGLRAVAVDVGGTQPRKVQYNPLTGGLRVKRLAALQRTDLIAQEAQYQESITKAPLTGAVELF